MDEEQVVWDKKKILIGCILLGIIGVIAYYNKEAIHDFNAKQAVAGIQTEKKQSDNKTIAAPKIDLQGKIADITEQVNNLDVTEVSASSPQIQKVLKDMESLKDLPRSQAREACMSICRGL